MESSVRRICKVCARQYANYTCPRCNIGYCSVSCYKQHSESCTESFYRQQAEQELKGTRAESSSKQAMVQILQRFRNQQQHAQPGLDGSSTDDEQAHLSNSSDDDQSDDGADLDLLYKGVGALDLGGTACTSRFLQGSEQHHRRQHPGLDGRHSSASETVGSESDGGSESQSDDKSSLSSSDGNPHSSSRQRSVKQGCRRRAAGSSHQQQRRQPDAVQRALPADTLARLLRKAEAAASIGEELEVSEDDLTPQEWEAFVCAMESGGGGTAAQLVQPWQPWWCTPDAADLALGPGGQRIVQELPDSGTRSLRAQSTTAATKQNTASGSGSSHLPAASMQPLPSLSSLTKAAPSPLLCWQLIELLFAYCLTAKRYNGQQAAHPLDAASVMMAVAEILCSSGGGAAAAATANTPTARPTSQAKHYGSPGPSHVSDADSGTLSSKTAAAAAPPLPPLPAPCQSMAEVSVVCIMRACSPAAGGSGGGSAAEAVAALYDVGMVLDHGRSNVLLALLDAFRTFEAAATAVSSAAKQTAAARPSPPTNRMTTSDGSVQSREQQGPSSSIVASSPTPQKDRSVGNIRLTSRGIDAAAGVIQAGTALRQHRQQLQAAARKLWFMVVWANEQAPESYESWATTCMEEWRSQQMMLQQGQAAGRVRAAQKQAGHDGLALKGGRAAVQLDLTSAQT